MNKHHQPGLNTSSRLGVHDMNPLSQLTVEKAEEIFYELERLKDSEQEARDEVL